MGILKAIGYAITGLLILITILFVFFLGGVAGGWWYTSRHLGGTTITYPVDDKEAVINLFADREISPEEIRQTLEEGTLTGQFQLFAGPFDWKLVGLRLGFDIPIEELLQTLVEEAEELMPEGEGPSQ